MIPIALRDDTAPVRLLRDFRQPPEGTMAIDLADGRRVFAPAGSDLDAEIASC
jgi:hypothetical protein